MDKLLDSIQSPADLRQMDKNDLPALAEALRHFIIQSVSQTGGHLASNLGCVELAIALHYVYNTPEDRLVWDVGHQSYAHKILTGRRDLMHTIRKQGGLSGFPKRTESAYDAFGVGHSSTSISAALGMAEAAKLLNNGRKSVAIIGDGAMTAGEAFEGLNNAGISGADILVILNDNKMAISPNVGALSNYLSQILSSNLFNAVHQKSRKVLNVIPPVHQLASKVKGQVKNIFVPGALFEQFGFNYIGPIDGHDLSLLVNTLSNIREFKGPQFLHIMTQKGYGYEPAEKDPVTYHGVSTFNPESGIAAKEPRQAPQTFTDVFSDWLCDMAAEEDRLVAITPAMKEGSGVTQFASRFPSRYFDVGIAEQHSVTFAAGLACEGLKPVVPIYSTFLQRAYDQLIHDVALQNLPVVFAIDRAGLVGADGATHAGTFDLSFLRCIPNMVIMAPSDENECRQMLYTAVKLNRPCAVRYPRGKGPGAKIEQCMSELPLGKGIIRRLGQGKVAFLVFGTLLHPVMAAAEQLDATVADMRFIKPIDETLILSLAEQNDLLVTVEENVIEGGAGSAVSEVLNRHGIQQALLQLGLPDRYIDHAEAAQQLTDCHLDTNGIIQAVQNHLLTAP